MELDQRKGFCGGKCGQFGDKQSFHKSEKLLFNHLERLQVCGIKSVGGYP